MKKMCIFSKTRNLLVAVLALVSIQAAQAQLFVTEHSGNVDEFTLTGSLVGSGPLITGLTDASALTISGGFIYIACDLPGTVYKYTLSGSQVGSGPIVAEANIPEGLAISGTLLFVSNIDSGSINEYDTDGTLLHANLISSLDQPVGMLISGSDLFVANGAANTINEYLLDGTPVGAGPLISGLNGPSGMALIGSNLFITNYGSGTDPDGSISEYTLTGSLVSTLVSGVVGPSQIATDGSNLFVTYKNSGTVEEYNATTGAIIGTDPLISGLFFPFGIAVVPEPSTWALLALGMGMLGYVQFRRTRRAVK